MKRKNAFWMHVLQILIISSTTSFAQQGRGKSQDIRKEYLQQQRLLEEESIKVSTLLKRVGNNMLKMYPSLVTMGAISVQPTPKVPGGRESIQEHLGVGKKTRGIKAMPVEQKPKAALITTMTSSFGVDWGAPIKAREALKKVIASSAKKPKNLSVRVIYMISKDRKPNKQYKEAIGNAIENVRDWYAKELGGYTFTINDPAVEVVQSDKDVKWFSSEPSSQYKDNWGFDNALAEAKRLIGARQNHPNHVWVIYSDGPGDKGRGGAGVAYLPENDLLGLMGKHPTQKDKSRWIAGLGHELGHALGLPHPKDTVKDADAIMWTGIYGKYPKTAYLTDDDKAILLKSRFISNPPSTSR